MWLMPRATSDASTKSSLRLDLDQRILQSYFIGRLNIKILFSLILYSILLFYCHLKVLSLIEDEDLYFFLISLSFKKCTNKKGQKNQYIS